MKIYYLFFTFIVNLFTSLAMAQVEGTVLDQDSRQPIAGATLRLHKANLTLTTDGSGKFMLQVESLPDSITVSYVGFQQQTLQVDLADAPLTIFLQASISAIDEVVINTGYYNLPKERATGSFSVIGEELLERSPAKNVIERLEGLVPGLVLDKRMNYAENPNNSLSIRIRGESSIHSNLEPLIILDNFPYEGDLDGIDPNEIEQVTVLKDAAAASIWGARAGNGVIVLTSKKSKGAGQQPRLTFNTGINIEPRPDFFRSPNYLTSDSFMEAEQLFFERGLYTNQESNLGKPVLSPMVEILIAQRDGLLTAGEVQHQMDSLRAIDVRKEAGRDLYRPAINQQHALSGRGGSNAYQYSFNVGWNQQADHIIGNKDHRFTFSSQQVYQLWKWLEIEGNIAYSNTASTSNGIGLVGLNVYPYTRFSDENGQAAVLFRDLRDGYVSDPPESITLDWQYRPLDEIELNDRQESQREVRLGGAANVSIISGLNLRLRYAYRERGSLSEENVHPDSYYIRNQQNRFTQPDGSSAFPDGGIYRSFTGNIAEHNGRAQLDFGKRKGHHDLVALVGTEIRDIVNSRGRRELYAYDPEFLTSNSRIDYFTRYNVLPRGTALIPTPINTMTSGNDRFLSYFANAAYTYNDKYTWSGSVRKDASNLFGVKTNQKWTPLWSTGLLWNISKEDFYDLNWLSDLRLRATYGHSGNVNNSITAYVTARYGSSALTGQRTAHITSPGNPQLQWEKVSTGNLALDFNMLKGRLSGTVEYFIKDGRELLGKKNMDPTSGLGADPSLINFVNYASTRTKGLDINLNSVNMTGGVSWKTSMYLSHAVDRVMNYDENLIYFGTDYLQNRVPPFKGRSLNSMYAIPAVYLDPLTGEPIVNFNGQDFKDYAGYFRDFTGDDLTYFGSTMPLTTGNLINTWSTWGVSISINLTWKAGYYFRAPSLSYKDLFEYRRPHVDFDKRWKMPGDELNTNIPSVPEKIDQYRDNIFLYSSALVEKGDHIRVKDISLSYSPTWFKSLFRNVMFSGTVTNLGFLYRANKRGLDPDSYQGSFTYPNPSVYSFRIKVELL